MEQWGRKIFIALNLVWLVSCSKEHGHEDLQKYVSDLSKTPATAIEALPEFKPYEQYIYDDYDKRSPFVSKKQDDKNIKNNQRQKQDFELYPIASLVMVGTIADRDIIWGLVQVPSGEIYRVTIGQYLGNNSARIVAIDKNGIYLESKVFDNDQKTWIKQKIELPLQSGGDKGKEA